MQENELMTDNKKEFRLFAKNIVKAKCRKIFAQNKTLFCLIKSETFFDSVLNIFNKLFHLNILPEKFDFVVKNSEFSKTDKDRLNLFSMLYSEYILIMQKNSWDIPFPKKILKDFLFSKSLKISELKDLLPQKKAYIEFSDIQTESVYIASTIKKEVADGLYNYNEIGVFVDKSEARQKLLDVMKSMDIPVESSIYNENYENLKHKITTIEQISKICKDLKLDKFSAEDFKNIHGTTNFNLISKSQTEICMTKLDEILHGFLLEILPNSQTLNKILVNRNNSNQLFFIDLLYSSWGKFEEKEQAVLISEFGLIKSFYEFYKQDNFAEAISFVIKKQFSFFENTEFKTILAGKMKSLSELQNLYDVVLLEKPQFAEFFTILEEPSFSEENNNNKVTLSAISASVKKTGGFKKVFLAGLTENNFPGGNISYPFISLQTNSLLNEQLKNLNPEFDYFLLTDDIHLFVRNNDIKSLIKQAQEEIVFSCHLYESKKTVLPAVIFKMLVANDLKNYKQIKSIEDKKSFENNSENILSESPQRVSEERFVVDMSNLSKNNEYLKLNPSAISTFQNCPRKYFYKNLLNLKEQSNFAASYGSIVHAVFELMNRNFLNSYNKDTAIKLAEILFESKTKPQPALDKGFKQTDVDLVDAADELSLIEMKENFQNAIHDYENSGYFEQKPIEVVCEKSFSFSIPELPNVVFDGRIDAILTGENGEIVVIDYKTGHNKINSLEYSVSEFGVNFKSKTGKDPSNVETLQNSYDYQIPIYYLACQNAESLNKYKNKVDRLGLLYIRPTTKDNGCFDDIISAEKLAFYKDKIIKNLKETIVNKICNQTEFLSKKNFACANCSYKFLCDNGGDDE